MKGKKTVFDLLNPRGLGESFEIATKGISYLFLHHRNMRFIFLIGIAAILLGFYFKLHGIELIALSITITLVFVAEILNTAIELMLDAVTKEYNYKIKLIKDIAAGVVVITCVNALLIGYVLFIHRFLK
ncbi:MAG: diacylglycerol kinase family protein [Candidatus Omnitrophica bacterium]|nr:diacylglycerol kinase family protein [Candidatus Omnitrophota bacterium]